MELSISTRRIKLHPRTQRFLPNDPRLESMFAPQAERSTPILIHRGRGLPAVAEFARPACSTAAARQALIVARAGVRVDLLAAITRE